MSYNYLPDFDIMVSEVILAHECIYSKGTLSDSYSKGRMCGGMVYVISGEAIYSIPQNDDISGKVYNKTIVAKEGNVIFLPPTCAYNISSGENSYFHHYTINFNLGETEKGNFLNPILTSREINVLETKNNMQYYHLFEKMSSIWQDKKGGYQLLCKSYLYEAFYNFFYEYIGLRINQNELDLILPAKLYLDEYYMENTSAEQLAEMCGISQTHFRRLFKILYGMSPVEYRINRRMIKAKDLLLIKGYSVNEIAEMTGFSDSNYFSRIFKQKVGISPLEYRNTY